MANNIRSVNDRDSRYVWGGITTTHTDRAGWWERRELPLSADDIIFTITRAYNQRPDLVAYDLYGKAKLQTLVLQYNNILDPTTEFVTGKQIRLPTQSRVMFDFLNQTPGGEPTE